MTYNEKMLTNFIKTFYDGDIMVDEKYGISIPAKNLYIKEFTFTEKLYDKRNLLKEYKTELQKAGKRIIEIFEDEMDLKTEIVYSRIRGILGYNDRIYARKCMVREIPFKVAKTFLEINHIQGSCVSKYNYGLEYNGEIVAIMTFGKSRFKKDEIELLRYASKLGTNVIGGGSRLLKHFIRQSTGNFKLVSYADARWSEGGLYNALGFTEEEMASPTYSYIDLKYMIIEEETPIRETRIKYQRHKLEKVFGRKFDEALSEGDIMRMMGYARVFDAGNYKFAMDITKD